MVVPLKDKKGVSIVNAFQKILESPKRKPKTSLGRSCVRLCFLHK